MCGRCGAPELIEPVRVDAYTNRLRPDPSVCVEFELDVTTLTNTNSESNVSYTFPALPCASLLLLLRGRGVNYRRENGNNDAAEVDAVGIEEGSVLFLGAGQSITISSDIEPDEEVVVFRAHINLGSI
jgi:hypothetical protein